MTSSRLEEGTEFNILRLAVKQRVSYDLALPVQLSRIPRLDSAGAQQRQFTLTSNGSRWLINGASFEMEKALFEARSGASEVWEISNTMMSMPHPMHLHGTFFKLLARNGVAADEPFFRDTVLIRREETIEIGLVPVDRGRWMMHCHILEHAESGMMALLRVE